MDTQRSFESLLDEITADIDKTKKDTSMQMVGLGSVYIVSHYRQTLFTITQSKTCTNIRTHSQNVRSQKQAVTSHINTSSY